MTDAEGLRFRTPVDAALRYAQRGWPVVPVFTVDQAGRCSCGKEGCTNQGKHPRAQRGFRDGTTSPSIIKRHWRQDANVGICTGRSAGIWVLDVDPQHDGDTSLARLLERHGDLPVTVESRTGRGGRHLYFRYPEDREVRNSVGKIAAGLDVRSDRGGVVAPPSRHISGRRYEWAPGRSPDDVEVADAPAWIFEELDTADRRRREARAVPPRGGTAEPASAVDANSSRIAYAESALASEITNVVRAKEGYRNSTLHTAAVALGSLVGAGLLTMSVVERSLTGAALGAGLPEDEIRATLASGLSYGMAHPRNVDDVVLDPEAKRRKANQEAQRSRQKRLRDNADAMGWLADLGLGQGALEHFGFGLEMPYESKSGKVFADALTFPLRAADGTLQAAICKADVPGVTKLAKGLWWLWAKDVGTYYAETQTDQGAVVVCDMPDLWVLWQALRERADLRVQIIASPVFDKLPPEWLAAAFWDRWSAIYVTVAEERGDTLARRLVGRAGKPVFRLAPPKGRRWLDAFAHGADADSFAAALAAAKPVSDRIEDDDDAGRLGRLEYRPLDIGRAYHKGCLYYTVDTLVRDIEVSEDGSMRSVERLETVVVRSDGEILNAVEMPAPKGTPPEKRVMRLNDGTLIDSMPKAPTKPSWS